MKHLFQTAVLGLSLTACSTPKDAVATAATTNALVADARPSEDAHAPFRVTWREESRTERRAVIVAVVERFAMGEVPLEGRLEVPAGVEVEGPRTFRADVSKETPTTFEQQYVLQFDRVPTEDLLLVVESRGGSGFGFHARIPYRFGRTAPQGPRPERSGPSLKAGGLKLGPAVRVDQKRE
jgi:hypothetical protein